MQKRAKKAFKSVNIYSSPRRSAGVIFYVCIFSENYAFFGVFRYISGIGLLVGFLGGFWRLWGGILGGILGHRIDKQGDV